MDTHVCVSNNKTKNVGAAKKKIGSLSVVFVALPLESGRSDHTTGLRRRSKGGKWGRKGK